MRLKFPRGEMGPFAAALREHVLPGLIPEKPLLSRSQIVLTQGSCFAQNLYAAMRERGIRCGNVPLPELANSPLANRYYLEYALTQKPFETQEHKKAFSAEVLQQVRETIAHAAAMIFTVGVAYCPFVDGKLVLNGIYKDDIRGLSWRRTSAQENVEHLCAIIACLRNANPKIHIVLTVSPIPMVSGMDGQSPFATDCASKSKLRAAVADVLDKGIAGVSYWPSFEALRWLPGHIGQVFGVEGQDQRHPGPSFISEIVDAFIEAYFEPLAEGVGPQGLVTAG